MTERTPTIQKILHDSVTAIGGFELRAYGVAIALGTLGYLESSRELSAFVIRREKKGHALKRRIEGIEPSGQTVLIVAVNESDAKEAIEICEAEGLRVERVVVI